MSKFLFQSCYIQCSRDDLLHWYTDICKGDLPRGDLKRGDLKRDEGDSKDRFPYAVALFSYRENAQYELCSGVYIGNGFVLTAAHCVGRNTIAYIGEGPISEDPDKWIPIEKAFIHPAYTGEGAYPYDVAILRLQRMPEKSIPVPYIPEEINLINENIAVFGYGRLDSVTDGYSDKLQVARTLKVVPTHDCGHLHWNLMEHHLCLHAPVINFKASSNACGGDSGGGIVVLDKTSNTGSFPQLDNLVGIISQGEGPCNDPDKYGLHVNVMRLKPWIDSITKAPRTKSLKPQEGSTDQSTGEIPTLVEIQGKLSTLEKEIKLLRTSSLLQAKIIGGTIIGFIIGILCVAVVSIRATKLKRE